MQSKQPPHTPPRRRGHPTYREEQQARKRRRQACAYAAAIAPERPRIDLELCDYNNRWKQYPDFETREELNAFYDKKQWTWDDQLSPEGRACCPPPRRRLPKDTANVALQNLRLDANAWMGDTLWDINFNPPDSQKGFYGGLQYSELCFQDITKDVLDLPSSSGGATKK